MRLWSVMLCAGLAAGACVAVAQTENPDPCKDQSPEQDCDATPQTRPPCIPNDRLYQFHIVYKNRPYSGIRVSTCEKKLEDGTVFKATKPTWEFRDSQGRMRVEERDDFPEPSKRHAVRVYDPVAHVSWNWTEGENANTTAVKVRYKPSEDFIEPEINRRVLQNGNEDPPILAHMANPDLPRQKQVILKPSNINGVWAEGDRLISISYPGDAGNTSKQVEVRTDEFWVSVDLELEIRHIADDPRQDKSIVNLLNIDRAEPDAALFRPPAGYEVLDATPKDPVPERNPLIVIPVRDPNADKSPN